MSILNFRVLKKGFSLLGRGHGQENENIKPCYVEFCSCLMLSEEDQEIVVSSKSEGSLLYLPTVPVSQNQPLNPSPFPKMTLR